MTVASPPPTMRTRQAAGISKFIGPVLIEFADRGVPPGRALHHKIELLPGAKPVNVHAYCYSHTQKGEIERQNRGMLYDGVIQPSRSPFSSPALLVKKKDGNFSWIILHQMPNYQE